MIYYILILLIIILGLFAKKKEAKLLYTMFNGLMLFLVAALRRGVGTDYWPYANMYVNEYTHDAVSPESAFRLLTRFFANVSMDYQLIFIAIAIIVALSVTLFIYNYSSSIWLSFFIFVSFGCFYFSLNFLRQVTAAIVILFALHAFNRKDYIYYFILILFASFFHRSALIFIPITLLFFIPFNTITLVIYTTISTLFFVYSIPITRFFTSQGYYSSYPETNIHMTTGIPVLYGIFMIAVFIFIFIVRDDCIKKREFNKILIPLAFLNTFFTIIGAKHSILSRFSILTEIPVVTILLVDALSIYIKKANNIKIKTIILVSFVLISLGFHEYLHYRNYNGVFPYASVWEVPLYED